MRDIVAEYKRLYGLELTEFGLQLLNLVKADGGLQEDIDQLISNTADRIYDISNADFEDNFNHHHREEQPF